MRAGTTARRVAAVVAWLLLAAIVFSTLSPAGMRPRLGPSVDFERFAAFAVLGLLFSIAYPRRAAAVVVGVVALGAGLELLQMLAADRHARLADLAVKAAGGICGVVCGRLLARLGRERAH